MIYRFRVILDAQEDVFRDIEIQAETTLEDFHNAIIQAFGFGGQEMASFYLSDDDWEQGDEIPLFDMSEEAEGRTVMRDIPVEDVVHEDQTKLIYVYDYFNLWTFLVELAEVAEPEEGRVYPNLMFAHGHLPEEAPDKEFIAEGGEDDFEEDYGLDAEDYDSFDFDENWN